jgi:hypothetical protein
VAADGREVADGLHDGIWTQAERCPGEGRRGEHQDAPGALLIRLRHPSVTVNRKSAADLRPEVHRNGTVVGLFGAHQQCVCALTNAKCAVCGHDAFRVCQFSGDVW